MKFVCIHGHFYQPPRENPWLEIIQTEDSAYPYNNWNHRITAECYGPNMAARLLDDSGLVENISNNYSRISFNFGPTLLSWLESKSPEVYGAIQDADRKSIGRFSGHGAAIAQPYNHMIMPLANLRDRKTQVKWGISDFEHRFKRPPEGMWLPETAVDNETLQLLAEQHIRFTILSPRQALRVRRIGDAEWQDVTSESVECGLPYSCRLPSGLSIAIFFFDGGVSHEVAFDQLLDDGHLLAERLSKRGKVLPLGDSLVSIATDGESYGHHHRFGEMALAVALDDLDLNQDIQLTNYAEYLASHEPEHEVEIRQNTSWSCPHGIERWRDDCGCNSGAHPGWHQAWRRPMRNSLDFLRDSANELFERAAAELLKNPWEARDTYVALILDRSPRNVEQFLALHAVRALDSAEQARAVQLCELQRHLMLMYTSCGWFFEEIADVESTQVLAYAGRAIDLARHLFGVDFEPPFLNALSKAKSNIGRYGDGSAVYAAKVTPLVADEASAAVNGALLHKFGIDDVDLGAFDVSVANVDRFADATLEFATGSITVSSHTMARSRYFDFAVVVFDRGLVSCAAKCTVASGDPSGTLSSLRELWPPDNAAQLIAGVERVLGTLVVPMARLLPDVRRRIVESIVDRATARAAGAFDALYGQHVSSIRSLKEVGRPVADIHRITAQELLNRSIRRELRKREEPADSDLIRRLLDDAADLDLSVDSAGLGLELDSMLGGLLEKFRSEPFDAMLIDQIDVALDLARSDQLSVDMLNTQRTIFEVVRSEREGGEPESTHRCRHRKQWRDQLRKLAARASVRWQ